MPETTSPSARRIADRLTAVRRGRFVGREAELNLFRSAQLTEHVLRLAGVRPGMRVLDVGCGTGDVSFLAASLVGPEGEVIGVDKSPEAVALASQRAAEAGLHNVHFRPRTWGS
jgi:cyclopropane fatty-acyl-phospholipid synthase-like methyltransferase